MIECNLIIEYNRQIITSSTQVTSLLCPSFNISTLTPVSGNGRSRCFFHFFHSTCPHELRSDAYLSRVIQPDRHTLVSGQDVYWSPHFMSIQTRPHLKSKQRRRALDLLAIMMRQTVVSKSIERAMKGPSSYAGWSQAPAVVRISAWQLSSLRAHHLVLLFPLSRQRQCHSSPDVLFLLP